MAEWLSSLSARREGNSLATAVGGVPLQAGKTVQISWYRMAETYILKSEVYQRFYVGSSENAEKRLLDHNKGKVRSTKAYCPWKIVYCEGYSDRQTAYRRELQIKSYKSGEAFKKLVGL